MASPSYTYTLTNGTTADASQVMQNFNDILNGVTDGSKDLSISALTVAGTATLNGNINLGNASADDLTITASLASSLAIKTTNTYTIGASTLVLAGIYSTTYFAGAGTAAAPAFEFTGDTNTGIYSVGADDIGISTGGTLRFDISTTAVTSTLPFLGAAGTAGAPQYSYSADTNTGAYSVGADDWGVSTGGTLRFDISTTAITSTIPHLNAAGTAGAPAFSFSADTNTGVYSVGADDIGIATGGTLRFDISTTAITSTIPHLNADGAVTAPAYSFSGDTDTGMYRIGANDLGFATNGVLNLEITAAGGTKIRGIAGNTAPAALFVGETITSTISSAQNAAASNSLLALTSIVITAGDWDVSVSATLLGSSATFSGVCQAVVARASADSANTTSGMDECGMDSPAAATGQSTMCFSNLFVRSDGTNCTVNGTNSVASQTLYLNVLATYSAGTPTWRGTMTARRRT